MMTYKTRDKLCSLRNSETHDLHIVYNIVHDETTYTEDKYPMYTEWAKRTGC